MDDVLGTLLSIVVGIVALTVFFGTVLGLCVKFFARSLRLTQALAIGWVGGAAGGVVFAIYNATGPNLEPTVVSLAGSVMLCVMGIAITRRARTYGVQKTGFLGAGAKSVLCLAVLLWMPVLIMALTGAFK